MGRLTHRTKAGWTYFVTTKAWQSTFLFQTTVTWIYGSASGRFRMDPIPQGLKPWSSPDGNVGAKAPTPDAVAKGESEEQKDMSSKEKA
jgi:hypothetical protein